MTNPNVRPLQERKPMTPYRQRIATVAPPTLQKQLEVLATARALLGQDDEAVSWRLADIAALRRELGELVVLRLELQREYGEFVELVQELQRRRDPRLHSHVIRDDADQPAALKASPDDPKHPGWPAGTPEGRGGKFRPKDGDEGAAAAVIPVQYGPNPKFPPPPPGYDPKTWKQGRWWNNKYFLNDPKGNTYTVHPEDGDHWPHWDIQDGDGNNLGRWPPNSLKPREGQKKLREDQSVSDPNGDAPPWTPDPFVEVSPVPQNPVPRSSTQPPIRTNPIPRTFEFEPPIRIPELPILIPE
jgi:hypothetical protein